MTKLEKARAIAGVCALLSLADIIICLILCYGIFDWIEFFQDGIAYVDSAPVLLFSLLGFIFLVFFGFMFYVLHTLCKEQWD